MSLSHACQIPFIRHVLARRASRARAREPCTAPFRRHSSRVPRPCARGAPRTSSLRGFKPRASGVAAAGRRRRLRRCRPWPRRSRSARVAARPARRRSAAAAGLRATAARSASARTGRPGYNNDNDDNTNDNDLLLLVIILLLIIIIIVITTTDNNDNNDNDNDDCGRPGTGRRAARRGSRAAGMATPRQSGRRPGEETA